MLASTSAALAAFGVLASPAAALVVSPEPHSADVYGLDSIGGPLGDDHTVELLRFITAYGTGIEALVDLTPYSPLLEAGRVRKEGFTAYAFIDTWVNNETGSDAMYMNNVTEKCYPIVRSYGNGWSLSAELVFWPKRAAVVRPKHSVTLSSGFYGGNYGFGRVSVHQGKLTQNASVVLLDKAVDLRGASHANVYECRQGPPEMEYAARMGYLAQQIEALIRKDGNNTGAERLMNQTYQSLAMDEFVGLGEPKKDPQGRHGNRSLILDYDKNSAQLVVGMPVYFIPGDIFTDQEMQTGLWWNMTYPFEPVGNITAVHNRTVNVLLERGCIPTKETKFGSIMPRLMTPRNTQALPDIKAMLNEVGDYGTQQAKKPAPKDVTALAGIDEVKLLLPHRAQRTGPSSGSRFTVEPPKAIGKLVLKEAVSAALNTSKLKIPSSVVLADGGDATKMENVNVCVVEQRRQGRLFERKFRLADLEHQDVAILQLTVTGHGWSSTTEQCGEYCHALYQLRFNGNLAHNVSEFRNDCKINPIGVNTTQIGTWWESRNGWCPGSVEPGIFVDVTKWLRKGHNHLEVDVLVWSEATKSYELYTDLSGFAFGDQASLAVGLNLFVYGADAVAAARAKAPSTPAEVALKVGFGGGGELNPTGPPVTDEGVVQLARRHVGLTQVQVHHHHKLGGEGGSDPLLERRAAEESSDTARSTVLSFAMRGSTTNGLAKPKAPESRPRSLPPWYLLNSSVPEQVEASDIHGEGVVRVPALVGELMQGAHRVAYANVSASQIPKDWDSVAVHFKLEKPPQNLSFDHWDRIGSFGLKLPAAVRSAGINLHSEPASEERQKWHIEAP